MTRDEMLKEIAEHRKDGHKIGIDGHVGDWRCLFDEFLGTGKTPMEAFIAARDQYRKPHVLEPPTPKRKKRKKHAAD